MLLSRRNGIMKKTLNLARSFRMYAVLVCMMILMALSMPERAEAATKKINVGSSVTFSVSGPAKWSLSNKKVAKIKAIGSRKAKVTGIKAGTTKVTARVGDKKYTINLTIKAAAKKKTKKSVSPKAANDNAAVQVNARSIPGSRDMVFTVDTGATVTVQDTSKTSSPARSLPRQALTELPQGPALLRSTRIWLPPQE